MTLLMFLLDEDLVVVAADTVATDLDGNTLSYDHKIHDIGGAKCAVATGVANVLFEWLRTDGHGKTLDSIAATAPSRLSAISRRLGEGVRATIYVFGRDAPDAPYSGLVFRAEDQFNPEPLRYGFHAKPPVHEVIGATLPEGPGEWIELAERLKAHEDAKPARERVPIGGELDLAILMDGTTRVATIHRFR